MGVKPNGGEEQDDSSKETKGRQLLVGQRKRRNSFHRKTRTGKGLVNPHGEEGALPSIAKERRPRRGTILLSIKRGEASLFLAGREITGGEGEAMDNSEEGKRKVNAESSITLLKRAVERDRFLHCLLSRNQKKGKGSNSGFFLK